MDSISLTSVLDDQSIVILGRRWPRILDDPEPKISVSWDGSPISMVTIFYCWVCAKIYP